MRRQSTPNKQLSPSSNRIDTITSKSGSDLLSAHSAYVIT